VDSTPDTGDARNTKRDSWRHGGWQAPTPPKSAQRYTFHGCSTGFWGRAFCELRDEAGSTVAKREARKVHVVGEEAKVYRGSYWTSAWVDVGTGQVPLRQRPLLRRWTLAGQRLNENYTMKWKSRLYPKGDSEARGLLGLTDGGGDAVLTVRWTDLSMRTGEVIVYTPEQPDVLLLASVAIPHFREQCVPRAAGA
jgi:hypothetical protein